MIHSLRIVELAHIRNASISFRSGLNVLTGESGAGKSVVLDALALVSGAARPRLRPRLGAKSGFVEAEFKVSAALLDGALGDCLHRHGLSGAVEDHLVLGRRVESNGRSRCFFQGQTVTRTVLCEVAGCFLELCHQAEAHSLRTPAAQLVSLDRFGRLLEPRKDLEALVRQLQSCETELAAAEHRAYESERRRDFLEFQLGELEAAPLEEWEDLERRLMEVEERAEAQALFGDTMRALNSAQQPLVPALTWLLRRTEQAPLERMGEAKGELQQKLQVTVLACNELEQLCRSMLEDEAELGREGEKLAARLEELRGLARKHRVEIPALLHRKSTLRSELSALEEEAAELLRLREEAAVLRGRAESAARALHKQRRSTARRLERAVASELEQLTMPGARLSAHLSEGELGRSGITHLEFGFQPHPGARDESLARVASGGELARILLAFRLAAESSEVTLSFDEIDAGAGGQTATRIAQALQRAASGSQVLCVTHWPQVASFADHHLHVSKETGVDDVEVRLCVLTGEDRLRELSRMLGGRPDSETEATARQHAARLLEPDAA